LPEYMVPNIVAVLQQLPVTPHGKRDRNALPWPVASGVQQEAASAVPPETPAAPPAAPAAVPTPPMEGVQEQIINYAVSILQCGQLTADADLFDLGATSLSLVNMAEWIRKQYGVEVPVDVFLDEPTVRHIVGYLIEQGVSAPAGVASETTAAPTDESSEQAALEMFSLPQVKFRASAYLPEIPHQFAATPVAFSDFSNWLTLLGAAEKDGSHKYMYPSAGGLNTIRTYVAVKHGAVSGMPSGVYYFHPISHTLHRVGDIGSVTRSAFCEFDQAAFDSAAVAVFFVAALDAITPLYQYFSGILVAVETGYMAQLLTSRQSRYGLEAHPVARVDYEAIQDAFALGPNEKFVHCLLAGAAPGSGREIMPDRLEALARNTPFVPGSSCLNHREILDIPPKRQLSKKLLLQIHEEHRHLRDVSNLPAPVQLPVQPFPWDDYHLRACQRVYDEAIVPLKSIAGLLSMFQEQIIDVRARHLFGSAAGRREICAYLYIRGGRVEGLEEGFYRYDEEKHTLVRCSDLSNEVMAQAYSPYNTSITNLRRSVCSLSQSPMHYLTNKRAFICRCSMRAISASF
ncbi:MAG: phosphopantetheine-binding protein, partial [Alphaproteobacteria bacterium]